MHNHYEQLMGESEFLKATPTSFLETDHYIIHYAHAGTGDPLILIHGGGMWLYSFRHTISPLSEHCSVYALDMPGYGFTNIIDQKGPIDLGFMTLAIKEFMDGLGISKVSLLGHSWGGGWVLDFVHSYPERVDKIILIDSSGLDVSDVLEWELLKLPFISGILLRLLTPGMIRRRLERSFFQRKHVDDAMAYEVYLPLKSAANRKLQSRLARRLSWRKTEEHLDAIIHPVLLIWGEHDRYLDVSLAERFKTRIRNIRVEIINGCGHSVHEEAPEKVNRLITEFLNG
jgi:pimeloyl-ACP methyl ester carboxylesterase